MRKLIALCITILLLASAQAATITSTGVLGSWNQTASWVGGVIPGVNDDVIIPLGSTVTLGSTENCKSLTVKGYLRYSATTSASLSVSGDVTIATTGQITTLMVGSYQYQALNINGNLTNNGLMDLTNTNSYFVILTFGGATNATWDMNSGSITDVCPILGVFVNKGSSTATTLTANFNSTSFSAGGANTTGFVQLFNGLFIIGGTATISNPVFGVVSYTLSTSGLQLNNSNFTILGNSGTISNSGLIQINAGTFNAGLAAGDALTGDGDYVINGGVMNVASQWSSTNGTLTMSGGIVNITTVGNATSNAGGFDFASTSTVTLSGGTINLVQASTGSTPVDFRLASTALSITSTTLNVGTSATAANYTFRLSGALPNLNIDNTTHSKIASLIAASTGYGNVTVNTTSTLSMGSFIFTMKGSTLTNSSSVTGTSYVNFAGASAQSYTGSGTVSANMQISNATGVTLSSNLNFGNSETLTVNAGALLTAGTNLITFGTAGTAAITGTLQTANTTGFSGLATTTIVSTNTPTITLGASSTIVYNNAIANQNVTSRAYSNVTFTGTATKTLIGAISIANNGTMTVSASSVLDASTFLISFGTTATAAITGTLKTANTFGFSGLTTTTIVSTNNPTITLGSASTIEYNNGVSNQNITARAYANLSITGASTKFLTGATSIGNSAALNVTTSAILDAVGYVISFGTSASANIVSATVRTSNVNGLSGSAITTFNFTNSPTISLGVTSTIDYYNAGAQTVSARTDYANLTVSGNRANATLTFQAGTIGVSGAVTLSATNVVYSVTGNTFNYKGAGQTVVAFNYNNLDLAGATSTVFSSGIASVAGTFAPASITAASAGTIAFNGTGAQTVPAFTYNNLTVSGARGNATVTLANGVVALTGTLSFTATSVSYSVTGNTVNYKGISQTINAFNYNNLDLTGATTPVFTSGTVGIAGSLTPGTATSASTGTIDFNSSTAQTIAAFGFYNLTASGTGAKTLGGSVTVGANLSESASLNLNNYNLSVTGNFSQSNGTLTGGTGTLDVKGDFTRSGGTFTASTSMVSLSGSSTQNISGINGLSFSTLSLSGTGAKLFTSGENISITNFTVASTTTLGLTAASATTFSISSGLNYFATTGGTNIGSLTLSLTGVGGTINGSASVVTPNITIAASGIKTLGSAFSITAVRNFTIDGCLYAESNLIGGTGNFILSTGGKLYISHANGLSGILTNTGSKTFGAAQYYFDGTSAQSTGFSGLSVGTIGAINIVNTSGVVTLDANVSIANSGSLSLSASTQFDAGTKVISFGTSGVATINGTFKTANTLGLNGGASTAISSTNSPSISLGSSSTIEYNASASQAVTPRSDYGNLVLSNGQKSMSGNVTTSGNVTLSGSSKLVLGTNNFTVGGTVTGDASNYVVTNSTGAITIKTVTSGGKTFPIGVSTSSYSPVTIAQSNSLDWTINVQSGIVPSATNPSDALLRTWTITPSTNPTPTSATVTFQYNESDAGIAGTAWSTTGDVLLNHYNGSIWSPVGSAVTPTGTPGGTRTVTASGLSSFSPWALTRSGSALPVSFTGFSGRREGNNNLLHWTTSNEYNNSGFEVQRSTDGVTYTAISFVNSLAPNGISVEDIHYTYTDVNAAGSKLYYRLKQVDFDGHSKYSTVVLIQSDKGAGVLVSGLYPNPASRELTAWVNASARGNVSIAVVDMFGRTVQTQKMTADRGSNSVRVNVSNLQAGNYILQVNFENTMETSAAKFIKN